MQRVQITDLAGQRHTLPCVEQTCLLLVQDIDRLKDGAPLRVNRGDTLGLGRGA